MNWERTDIHMAMRNRGGGVYEFMKVHWLDLSRTNRNIDSASCYTVVYGTVNTNQLTLNECLGYISEIITSCCRNICTNEEISQLIAERYFEEATVCDLCPITTFQEATMFMECIMEKNNDVCMERFI